MGGESLNEGCFNKIPIIKQDTNFILQTFWSDKLLSTTIAICMPKNLHDSDFQVILSSSSWSRNKFVCIFLRKNMASKLSALKIVESAHMPELEKKIKTYSRKLETAY